MRTFANRKPEALIIMIEQGYAALKNSNEFLDRHLGVTAQQQQELADLLGYDNIEALIEATHDSKARTHGAGEPQDRTRCS
jgi:glycine cleavage system pyridoxal-binding protein P